MVLMNRRLVVLGAVLASMAGATGSTAVLAQAGAKPMTVRLQDFGPTPIAMPVMLGRADGLFEKAGVNLQVLAPIFNAGAIFQVLVQGQADIGYTGPTPMISLAQQGRPLKIVAVISQGFEIKVALTPKVIDDLAKKGITANSPIEARVQALRGLKLATPASGSTLDLGLRYALKKYGLDPARDVVIQPLPDIASMIAVVRQGAVDGVVGNSATAVGQSQSEGLARIFIEFEKHDKGLQVAPFNVLAANDDYIKNNPEGLRRTLTAILAAKNAIRRGLTAEEREKVKKQFLPDMNPATYNTLVDGNMPLLLGLMAATREQFEVLLGLVNAVADVPAKVTFDQVFDTRIAESVERK